MKKTMKKLAALLTVSTVAVGMLAGCGSGNGGSDNASDKGSSAATESSDGTYKIAMCQQHQTNAYQISITEAAQAKAKELGVELTIFDANQDAQTQITRSSSVFPSDTMQSCLSRLIRTDLALLHRKLLMQVSLL